MGFTERLADHPVGVEVDLPVVIVAAARAGTEQRTGRRELQQVHDRRRFGTDVRDGRQAALRDATGFPMIDGVGNRHREVDPSVRIG